MIKAQKKEFEWKNDPKVIENLKHIRKLQIAMAKVLNDAIEFNSPDSTDWAAVAIGQDKDPVFDELGKAIACIQLFSQISAKGVTAISAFIESMEADETTDSIMSFMLYLADSERDVYHQMQEK